MWSNDGQGGYSEQPSHGAGGYAPGMGAPLAIAPPGGPSGPGSQVAVMPPHAAGTSAAVAPSGGGALDGAFDIPATLGERIELCKFLAGANLLPQALRNEPANVLLIMHKAMALQVSLGVALEHLHVIDGKVGHSAELLRVLLRRAGHKLKWPVSNDKEVVGELTLRGEKEARTAKFSMADAQRMELTTKKNWRLDPESMLVARCTTRLVSRHCPEVSVALGNLSALDFEDVEPEPVRASAEVERDGVDPKVEQAKSLFAQSLEVSTVDDLKTLGRKASEAGLIEVRVDGDTTLQEALLHRIDAISKARAKDKPAETKPPGKGRGGE